jgi:hypothetical protein
MKQLLAGWLGLAAYIFASTVFVSTAYAADRDVPWAPQESEARAQPEPHWYGWQTLAVDGGAAALGITAVVLGSMEDSCDTDTCSAEPNATREGAALALGIASGVGYGAGAPTVHLLHGRPWHALGSFGLRAGLPVLGGGIGLLLAPCPPPQGDYGNCGGGLMMLGIGAGVFAAIALDANLLAEEPPESEKSATAQWSLAPVVSNDGKGGEFHVFGTF